MIDTEQRIFLVLTYTPIASFTENNIKSTIIKIKN